MLAKENSQLSFDAIPFLKFPYKSDHPLMQMEKAIRWDNLLDALAEFYSEEEGRPTISLRAKAGTLILKFVKKLSDRQAVVYVEENLRAQHFCGLTPDQASEHLRPESGLSEFRRQIGPKGMAFLEEVLNAAAEKKPLKRGNKVIIDATCGPLGIRYPTDIKLLERCRREVLMLIRKAKVFGVEASHRTHARVAKKARAVFAKLSKPKIKTRKKVHKQMLQFVRRNLHQLEDLRGQCAQILGRKVNDEENPRRFEIHRFLVRLKESEGKIRIILRQQKQIYRGRLRLPGRIASFHKDPVRPILRGKFPVPTEFGPKVLRAVVRGCTHVVKAFQDNLGKRCFGWARCLARNDDHEESWIRLGAAAMNVHLAYARAP